MRRTHGVRTRGVRVCGVRVMLWVGMALLGGGVMRPVGAQTSPPPHRVASDARADEPGREAESLLARPVTIDVADVSLQRALDLLAEKTQVRLQYPLDEVRQYTQRITVRLTNTPLGIAFERVLTGTGLHVEPLRDGSLVIVHGASDTTQASGTVAGVVTDAATKRPVAGAAVAIDSGRPVRTRTDGAFTILNVPAGLHRVVVHSLGYRMSMTPVTVRDGATATVAIALSQPATMLTEVVTTGAGDRRRVEIGNSVATINADSIVRTTPIRSLSDLLEARVPGVDVLQSSGEVGSPSTIRIRGAGSITSTTDPLVVVDGVRVNGGHKTGFQDYSSNPFVSGASTVSPLDDIDPESIESIDILRGPSASAIYGSDAANGVIVIKTKRGVAGPTRWNFFGESATSHLPGTYAQNYFGWGQNLTSDVPGQCTLSNVIGLPSVAAGTCTIDSVTHYNPLDAKDTSPFAHGNDTQYGGDVSGGTDRLQYFLGANYEDNVGVLKLSPLDYETLARLQPGKALTDWQQRPNVENGLNLNTRLTAHVANTADVAFSASALHRYHRNGYGIGGLIASASNQPGYRDTVAYGWGGVGGTPAAVFSTLSSDVTDRAYGNLNGTWRPWTWLNAHGTLGADHTSEDDEFLQPRGALDGTATGAAGQVSEGTRTTRVYTGDFGAEAAIPLTSSLMWRSSVGNQLNRTQFDLVGINGQGLAYGSTTTIGATTVFSTEDHATSATIGWYAETGLALAERLFATVSVRNDRGSAFSNSGGGATYPKFNMSWLASQEPIFQRTVGHLLPVSNFRLRAAYGQAGVQPDITARYLTYSSRTDNVDGQGGLVSWLNSFGNASLLPERSVETEGGFDLGLWNDRLTVEATWYRKLTTNALVSPALPPSFGNIGNYTTNLGRVSNHGVELTVGAQPIVSAPVTWNVTLTYSTNNNKLIKGNDGSFFGVGFGALQQRYVPGYPLAGYWDRPILAYADVNGDGIIEPSEIKLGDSAVYLGAPYPKADISIHQTLAFLSGRVSLGVGLDIRDHFTQFNMAPTTAFFYSRGINDPAAPFAEQVAAQEAAINLFLFGQGTSVPFVQNISWVRLSELSLTYTLPARIAAALRARDASLSLMGRNLGLWTKYQGVDPEVNSEIGNAGPEVVDDGGVPQPREWRVRLNLGF